METYLVGGAVRDALLGREPVERDWVVVGARPEDLEAAGYRRVGRDFPVFLHPQTREEYALARTERKSGHGYHGFEVHAGPDVTLEADLERRDLTINAMARDDAGRLIDPLGGRADLEAGLLRHVSPAFTEDPLRVLRVARFAARFAPLGFRVADETRELMRRMVASGELDWLVPERVWQETERALAEPEPVRYFRELEACGALATVLPELAPLFADGADPVPARALERAAAEGLAPVQRFAVLCHGLDPDTGLEALAQRLPVPRRWRAHAHRVARWQGTCRGLAADDADTAARLVAELDATRSPERLEALLRACDAIAAVTGDADWPARRQCLSRAANAAAAVTGGELAAEGWRGPALGRELERRRAEAIRIALADRGPPGERG